MINQPDPKPEPAPEPTPFVPLTATDLTFPEGATVSEELTNEFLEVVNNQELSPGDRANSLIALSSKLIDAASEANSAAWANTQNEWQAEVKTAYGDKMTETLSSVAKLVEEFGSPELRQVLDVTGAGNSVHLVRFLATLSEKLTEGGAPLSGSPAATTSAAQRLFPSMKN